MRGVVSERCGQWEAWSAGGMINERRYVADVVVGMCHYVPLIAFTLQMNPWTH